MATVDSPGPIRSPLDLADTSTEVLDATSARHWLLLAVGVLMLAGIMATLLVIGRVPPLDRLFADPLMFRRGLVVHVDLALVAWFYCFITGLWFLLPARGHGHRLAHFSVEIAIAGIVAMVLGAGVPGAEPVLSNYIPVIDHPLFLGGLGLLFAGISLAFLDPRLLPSREALHSGVVPDAARPALRAAALAFLLAMVTLVASWTTTPDALQTQLYYEFLFWGAGHTLQVASVLGMLAAWTILLSSVTGRTPVPRRLASVLCGGMLLPMLAGPVLALNGTATATYRAGFTQLMRWGIWPFVTIFFLACVHHLIHARRQGRLREQGLLDPRLMGFYASAGLTILGFVLGALIRGSNTMVPAHYHAAIGAVTASFMAVTWVVFEPLGLRLKTAAQRRWAGWQPVLFGAGQMVFAVGFGWAGAHGMARKTYGQEQQIHSAGEYLGLAVMGLGGLVAVAGGILFLALVVQAWRSRHDDPATNPMGSAA